MEIVDECFSIHLEILFKWESWLGRSEILHVYPASGDTDAAGPVITLWIAKL